MYSTVLMGMNSMYSLCEYILYVLCAGDTRVLFMLHEYCTDGHEQ